MTRERAAGGAAALPEREGHDRILENIRAVAQLEAAAVGRRAAFGRLTDRVTHAAGTPWVTALHLGWFVLWVAFNTLSARRFDPFPFSLLTSIVSLEVIFLTLFILSSQNRMTDEADKRAHLDLQVNILAEQEMTLVLRLLRDLCEKAGVDAPDALEGALREVNIETVAESVEREISSGAGRGEPP